MMVESCHAVLEAGLSFAGATAVRLSTLTSSSSHLLLVQLRSTDKRSLRIDKERERERE